MSIDLYHIDPSPPCRGPRLTAAALGVDLNLKKVDLFEAKEHLKPEFLKVMQYTNSLLVVVYGYLGSGTYLLLWSL